MKKIIRSLVFLLLFAIVNNVSAQKTEKIYYDYAWKGTTPDKASFFRLITYDKNNQIIGKVKDYYISGELQAEGEALKIDRLNDVNSKWKNTTTAYYKNGGKKFEQNYDAAGKEDGPYKSWDEDGGLTIESHFDNYDLATLELSTSPASVEDLMTIKDTLKVEVDGVIKRTKNKAGNNVFDGYDKNNLHSRYIISINPAFISGKIAVLELEKIEKELSEKSFVIVASLKSKIPEVNAYYLFTKWEHKDYPYRFILRSLDGRKKSIYGAVGIVSELSSEFYFSPE